MERSVSLSSVTIFQLFNGDHIHIHVIIIYIYIYFFLFQFATIINEKKTKIRQLKQQCKQNRDYTVIKGNIYMYDSG